MSGTVNAKTVRATLRAARVLGLDHASLATAHGMGGASNPQVPPTSYGLLPATNRYLCGYMNVMGDLAAVLTPLVDRLAQP